MPDPTFTNLGFEDFEPASTERDFEGGRFLADDWTRTLSISGQRTADFGDTVLGIITRNPHERFEAFWTGLDVFLDEFDDPDTQLSVAQFDAALPDPPFGVEAFEDFEQGWDSNQVFFTELEDVPSVAALFDAAAEAFEDFENLWLSNETFVTVFSGTAAQFDPGAPESVEDFEEEWANDFPGFAQFFVGVPTDLRSAAFDQDDDGLAANVYPERFDRVLIAALTGAPFYPTWMAGVVLSQAGEYNVKINGVDHIYTSPGAETRADVRDALVTKINASSVTATADAPTADSAAPFPTIDSLGIVPDDPNTELVVGVSGPGNGDMSRAEARDVSYSFVGLIPPATEHAWHVELKGFNEDTANDLGSTDVVVLGSENLNVEIL
jgi:hypothetical protein